MTDTIIVSGRMWAYGGGRIRFEDRHQYVLTASVERNARTSWPEWHPRYTDPIQAKFRGSLGDLRAGRATIYGLNPVRISPLPGQFLLGTAGRIRQITSEYRGTFEDFSISPVENAVAMASAPDPTEGDHAESWVAAETSPTTAQGLTGSAWSRHSRVVYPPKSARYIVPHVRFGSMGANKSQYLDAFQMEVLPLNNPATPTTWVPPRQVKVRVKPTRLNLSINPSFEVTVANLTTQNLSATKDSTQAWRSGNSLKVSVPTGGAEVFVKETQDIEVRAGEPLTVSLHAYVPTILTGSYGIRVQFFTEAGADVSTVDSVDVIHEATGYDWDVKHLSTIVPEFATKAVVSTVHAASGPASGTDIFWIDAVLIEKSRDVLEYFDGNSGDDYLWRQGGTAGGTWSYYYEDRVKRHYILERTLRENVPLGITLTDPEYADGLLTVIRYGYGQYGYGPYGG